MLIRRARVSLTAAGAGLVLAISIAISGLLTQLTVAVADGGDDPTAKARSKQAGSTPKQKTAIDPKAPKLPEPPATWREHCFEHREPVKLVASNDDVAIYFDDAMPRRGIAGMVTFVTKAWQYTNTRRMTWGEFIHFMSGAAHKDIRPLARRAFESPSCYTCRMKADVNQGAAMPPVMIQMSGAIILCGSLTTALPALAEDRSADVILKEIDAIKLPEPDLSRANDKVYIRQFMKQRSEIRVRGAELIGELYRADPDNPRLVTLLPVRWRWLSGRMSGPGDNAGAEDLSGERNEVLARSRCVELNRR